MMKKGLFAVLALLIVFAMIGCDTGSGSSDNITITFNLGGAPGTPPASVSIAKGTPITEAQIPKPVWEGHVFKGWYNGDTKLEAGLSWQDNVVFTAKWAEGLPLSPWKPDTNPTAPTTGYKNFYGDVTDPDEWKYSTFAGSGNVGVIEANGDGTYNISIKTVPGGRSIVSFNSENYMFKNGYYLSFNFPENTEAKPIAAAVLAAAGSTNEEGTVWGTVYNVNTESGWAPTLDDVYLAGEIAFARDDLASLDTLYKSVLLELVWHEDEEAEYYEFTLKKLLITTGESLIPPDPNALVPWAPDPVPEPSGYVNFPGTENLRATYYPWNAGNTISTDGKTVTVVAPATGRTLVRLLGTDFNWAKGYYLSVTLPDNSNKPQKIYSLGTDSDTSDGVWSVSDSVEAPAGKFIAGRVDFTWAGEATDGYTGVMLDIYWYPEQTEAMYTFTINKILVAGEATEGPPAEKPGIHDSSQLADATYTVGATAAPLVVVPNWTANSGTYDYNWYFIKNPASEPPDPAIFNYYKWNGDGTNAPAAQGVFIVPPTNEAGTFYYYVTITFGSEVTRSSSVKIVVNP